MKIKATQTILSLLLLTLFMLSCKENAEADSISPVNWGERTIDFKLSDSLIRGTTYLSVYSQIYSETKDRTHDLTATVSMRNMNIADTIYVNSAQYFNTKGNSIRTYFDKTIFIAPMETVEIVIDEQDKEGGTGANFLFNWTVKPNSNEPYFEAVMISTLGQQGLTFSTQGRRLKINGDPN